MSHPRLVFPHTGEFKGPKGHSTLSAEEVTHLLSGMVSEQRLARLREVVAARCYGVVPVVEGVHDVGNISAVCRSADAMGLGAVHCVVNGTKMKQSQRTTAGAEKWLDARLWDSTAACLSGLRGAGYQIVVTALNDRSVTIQEVDWTRPTAFVLGNERDGVSAEAGAMADHAAVVPMAGFVESFNVSVAAAIIMWEAQQQRIRRTGRHGDLSPREAEVLLAEYLIRGVREPAVLMEELISRGCLVFDRQRPVKLDAARRRSAAWGPVGSWADWVGELDGRYPRGAAGGGGGGGGGGSVDASGGSSSVDGGSSGGHGSG
ncbi:hypothetical protein Rsub_11675 [Raphidocelis subcapitata]|uniref:tRNA/rRNA methyltransferase SpoU type domain-containing protein n=1 Tax=Raphidocelis subcapitata TaxID=307507 RepID=A0A2V0PMZ5_9CHLO|nr:hypothetical protein Rsub_11675 [Raphidocelis subcapitata]|eukprot:GBF98465.1 hypothetical protein Rsub_11675 [Raphidocelis subcapitata]